MDARRLARFYDKIHPEPNSGCWLWGGTSTTGGYGQFWMGRPMRMKLAHRVMWLVQHGEWPAVGMEVMHSCDNPPCCNPDHLSVGSPEENTADRQRRERWGSLPGESNPSAKIDSAVVRRIRRLYVRGQVTQHEVARMVGVSRAVVCSVVRGKTWAHVK